ncbi:MAG: hypothetical protein AAF628_09255 [Planctomycetota bacterium]
MALLCATVARAQEFELPRFDEQAAQIQQSLERLSPLDQSIREAYAELRPKLEAYAQDPTPESREGLERDFSALMHKLVQDVDTVIGEKERIKYAIEDIARLSRSTEQEISDGVAELQSQLKRHEVELDELYAKMRENARALKFADPDDKAGARREFVRSRRLYNLALRRRSIVANAHGNYEGLVQGVRAIKNGFDSVNDRIGGVFANIEDAAELLRFMAGLRSSTSRLLAKYQGFMGSGSGSLSAVVARLGSIEGQLDLLQAMSEKIDDPALSFAPMIDRLSAFGAQLAEREIDSVSTDDIDAILRLDRAGFERQQQRSGGPPPPPSTAPPSQLQPQPQPAPSLEPRLGAEAPVVPPAQTQTGTQTTDPEGHR